MRPATVSNPRTLTLIERIAQAWGVAKRTEVIDRVVEREAMRMRESGEIADSLAGDSGAQSDRAETGSDSTSAVGEVQRRKGKGRSTTAAL